MVEIAFQSCTPYHPDLPEHRHLTGWFPCVTSGNRSRDEGREQQEGSLEREDEVWLKVSGPSDFSERLPIPGASVYVRYMYMCVHVCVCMCVYTWCIGMACQEISFCYLKVFKFWIYLYLFLKFVFLYKLIGLSKCNIHTGECPNQKCSDGWIFIKRTFCLPTTQIKKQKINITPKRLCYCTTDVFTIWCGGTIISFVWFWSLCKKLYSM